MTEEAEAQINAMLDDEWEYGFKCGYQKLTYYFVSVLRIHKKAGIAWILEN